MNIRPAASDSAVGDAGKIRFATDTGSEPTIQGVIPNVQFEKERCIGGRDEVNSILPYIPTLFVRADPIERRHLIVRQISSLNLQSKTGMREPGDSPLSLRPFENRKIPCRPVLNAARTRIILLAQSQ